MQRSGAGARRADSAEFHTLRFSNGEMMKSEINEIIKKHEESRSSGINLIASENYLSEDVRKALGGDLAGRYHADWYGGTRYAREMIETTEDLAKELFGAEHAMVSPLSGNLCDLAALFAYTAPGDRVAILPFTVGGYPFGIEKFHRERVFIPVDEASFQMNIDGIGNMYGSHEIKLTILGSSFLLFPQPVTEVVYRNNEAENPGCCVYDGSHVLGLIASGEFQDPLNEGAEVLFGSTHKSFYGPQGGIILTNSSEHEETLRNYLDLDIDGGIGLVDNIHMNRIAALGLAMEEMLEDRDYGARVIRNAKALAKRLDELDVPVKFGNRGFTESHQVLLDMDAAEAVNLCHRLEKVGIYIDVGGRLGTAEITHRGMRGSDVDEIAELIGEVYHKRGGEKIRERVRRVAEGSR